MLVSVLSVLCAASPPEWMFLSKYPPQYVSEILSHGEVITIDGDINEPAWEAVPWTTKKFVDIAGDDNVLDNYQTKVKVRWDSEYLYIAAQLQEPLVWGNITGHNNKLTSGRAPWWNNDFEVFIDTHGSSHYYKEFEMNCRNATYDILWRVPDGGMNSKGVPCDGQLPNWCQNSTFNKGQTWTMYPRMKTATSVPMAFTPFGPFHWTTEIRFPIERNQISGGLVDTEPGVQNSAANPINNKTKFWWMNFARAQHPLLTVGPTPLGINFFDSNYTDLCAKIQKEHPTLLGTDAWGCYWEYVWSSMGISKYMHNPEMWGIIQFAHKPQEQLCQTQEWPGRYLTQMMYRSQIAFFEQHGTFTTDVNILSSPSFCNSSTICDSSDVSLALSLPNTYFIKSVVDANATRCVNFSTKKSTGGPCFNISVTTTAPSSAFVNTITIRENRLVIVDNNTPMGCLV